MIIRLYNFQKRKNSTKVPTSADNFTIKAGDLKEDFALTGLIVRFADVAEQGKIPDYNYALIEAFDRYYFITRWAWSKGCWFATFAEDVLGSKRSQLLATSQYVLRSARPNLSDQGILDNKYPAGTWSTFQAESIDNEPLGVSWTQGHYVIGVINDLARNGSVTYYELPQSAFNQLCSAMMSSVDWLDISIDEISEGLQKALINPMQYIVSCVRIPYNLWGGATTREIRLGWWSFSVSSDCHFVSSVQTTSHSSWVAIPKHPNASARGKYLNLSPFAKYTLTFLPFGVFEIDTTDICNWAYMHFRVTTMLATGDSVLEVQLSGAPDSINGPVIMTVNGNIGVQIPTGQIAANLGNIDQAMTYSSVVGGLNVASDMGDRYAAFVNRNLPMLPTIDTTPAGYGQGSGQGGGGQTLPGLGGGRR